MIPNQWYVILDSKELKKGVPLGITRLGERMVIWRTKTNEIMCLADQCAHRGASLALGKLTEDTRCIDCPFHGLRYNALGKVTLIPANGAVSPVPPQFKVRSYPTKEAHGFIWLWWGSPQEKYPDLPFIDDIDDSFHGYTYIDPWPMHYSRCIENQLDPVHLPFVHRTTIGKGNHTIIDGPITKLEGNTLRFWVSDRKEDGTPAKKAEELASSTDPFFIEFKFPHIWQNHILEKMRVLVAFVPVDESNTLIYMRYLQKLVRIPLLKQFFSWVGKLMSIVILHQDRRVVITQRPTKSAYQMDEKLFAGDMPIIIYRKRRQELLDAAKTNDIS